MSGSVVHLRFRERDPSLSPTDTRGSLQSIRADPARGLTMPGVVDGRVGAARHFMSSSGLIADDPSAKTLLLRDVTVRAVLKWDHTAQLGEGGVIVARGVGDSVTQYASYRLALEAQTGANGVKIGALRWWWQDLDGNEHSQPSGEFIVPADAYLMLTATREWLSTDCVLLRYWANARLLAEHEVTDGAIGGGVGGTVVIGARGQGAAYASHLRGDLDELEILDDAVTTEEVRTAYGHRFVHEIQAYRGLQDYHRVFDAKSQNPASLDQQLIRVKAYAFADLYAAMEDQHLNALPDRAYGRQLSDWETCLDLRVEAGASIATRRVRTTSALRREHGYSRPALRKSLAPLLDLDPEDIDIFELSNLLQEPFHVLDPLRWTIHAPVGDQPTHIQSGGLHLSAATGEDLRYPVQRLAKLVTTPVGDSRDMRVFAELRAVSLADGVLGGIVLLNTQGDAFFYGVSRQGSQHHFTTALYQQGAYSFDTHAAVDPSAPLALSTPVWLRLARVGDTCRLEYSLESAETSDMALLAEIEGIDAPCAAGLSLVATSAEQIDTQSIADITNFVLYTPNDTRPFYSYLYRDPALPGVADRTGAQAQLDRQKPAHILSCAISEKTAKCDDTASLADTTPLGGHETIRAARRFQEITGLVPDHLWPGHATDIISGVKLAAINNPAQWQPAADLKPDNGLTDKSFAFAEYTAEAYQAPNQTLGDLTDQDTLLIMTFRGLANNVAVLSLAGKRDPGAPNQGWEIILPTTGIPYCMCDSGMSAVYSHMTADLADNAWHTLVFAYTPSTGTFQLASEADSSPESAIPGDCTSAVPLALGASRLASAGVQVALFALCSGDQLQDIEPDALAAIIHSILAQGA